MRKVSGEGIEGVGNLCKQDDVEHTEDYISKI